MTLEDVKAYRARSYRTLPERRVNALEEAIDFVDERGFIHL